MKMKQRIRETLKVWKEKQSGRMMIRIACLRAGAIALVGVLLAAATAVGTSEAEDVMYGGELIRFHVLANSDSEEDQALKIRVRDRILRDTCLPLEKAQNTAEAELEIRTHMADIRAAALAEIREAGYDYPVSIQLGVFEFPIRSYGNVTLPAGRYPALRVVIGEGNGHNWWCVMFPPLCFVNESTANMPAEALNKLSAGTVHAITHVSAEETEDGAITAQDGAVRFQIRFKLLEWLRTEEK